MSSGSTLQSLGWSFVLGVTMTSACVDATVEAVDDDGTTVQEISGPSSPASQFQLDRAVKLPGCTATRISARFAITARHCGSNVGDIVKFYSTGPGTDSSLVARVEQVIGRPGTSAAVCQQDMNACVDNVGLFADVALLRLSNTIDADTDSLSGPQATLAWTYPGNDVTGTQVGAGAHNGNPNGGGILLQVNDSTDNSTDSDGWFETNTDFVDAGDSGGPFYVNQRVLGTLWGHGWNPLDGFWTRYTSVPIHLDWILTNIGYLWAGQPAQSNVAYVGSTIQSFTGTERTCQYACEKTASCQAYNFGLFASCSLVTNVTGTSPIAGTRSALHYGASSGKSNEVVGYVRGDGFNSVLHRATNGQLHEFFSAAGTWSVGAIAPAGMPAIAGKLSGYRRADGVNTVVYRSTSDRIIEVALVPSGWTVGDLTNAGGLTPAGDPVGYVRADGVSAVVYRATNGHISELRLGSKGWFATDLTAEAGSAVLASSDPSAFVRSDGRSSVVFRGDTNIFELFKSANQPWTIGGPSSIAGAPAAASRPYGYNHHDGITAIVYRSTANKLIELFLDGTGWHFGDITKTGQPVAGNPVAYVRTDAIESVVYRSTSNQINELTNNPWQAWNLTAQFGAGTSATDPAVYVRRDGFNAVLSGLAGNHAGELSLHIGDNWHVTDLTSVSGETP